MRAQLRMKEATRAGVRAALALLRSAMLWLIVLAVVGAVLVTAGVHALLGAGWSLIIAGGFFLAGAHFVMRGLSHG